MGKHHEALCTWTFHLSESWLRFLTWWTVCSSLCVSKFPSDATDSRHAGSGGSGLNFVFPQTLKFLFFWTQLPMSCGGSALTQNFNQPFRTFPCLFLRGLYSLQILSFPLSGRTLWTLASKKPCHSAYQRQTTCVSHKIT